MSLKSGDPESCRCSKFDFFLHMLGLKIGEIFLVEFLNDKNIENREEKFDFYKKILLYLEKIKQI